MRKVAQPQTLPSVDDVVDGANPLAEADQAGTAQHAEDEAPVGLVLGPYASMLDRSRDLLRDAAYKNATPRD